MIRRWGICLAILVVPALGAATIDVSTEPSAVVHTGDALVFQLLTGSFGVNAAAFGVPEYPADVSFVLVSEPMSAVGEFSATLESADREVSAGFGNLTFGRGYFQGGGYDGEVSTLQGYLHLAPLLSEALFSAPSVAIVLRNEGPDFTIGLAPYTLRQSLFASLSGARLSVGAVTGSVELEGPANRAFLMNFEGPADFGVTSEVPEPQPAGLLFGGCALLCGLSVMRARIRRGST
jgi:hypothetical protein